MFTLLLKKLATLVPTLLGVTLVAFALIRLIPGDPIEIMVGERRLDADAHAALMTQLGLDQPLPVQYLRYLRQLLQGDLGKSLVTREPVVGRVHGAVPGHGRTRRHCAGCWRWWWACRWAWPRHCGAVPGSTRR